MIGHIETDTAQAVHSMDSSNDLANRPRMWLRAPGPPCNSSSNRLAITERNLMIASATEEQTHVAREVDRSLLNISDLSLQNSAGSEQANSASRALSD
ncbi:hypothetical protein [Phytopseudomonas argentinensis]|uniref:hypothetical protein n=1 Tax=Phytopseudomonas argentinensis TaxID=289370 RepID=UPI000ADF5B71|nr:hypothetical protein [Pseudomonas argentinensis]